MRIAFRVDAAPHIGSGHLMRCLTLADTLSARGCDTHFLCRPGSASARAMVESRHHRWHDVPLVSDNVLEEGGPSHAAWLGTSQTADCGAAAATLSALRPDWLVVDQYALDHRWELQARPLVGRSWQSTTWPTGITTAICCSTRTSTSSPSVAMKVGCRCTVAACSGRATRYFGPSSLPLARAAVTATARSGRC